MLTVTKKSWSGKRFDFDLSSGPIICSIVNCTPDSFYDGNKLTTLEQTLEKVEQDIANGASIIELGGKSTKPGFKDISYKDEWKRVSPVIDSITKRFPTIPLSLDTNNSKVMKKALDTYNIDIINDIDGFETEEKLSIIQEYKPSVVVMDNGRNKSEFRNQEHFFEKTKNSLINHGLSKNQIVIDPGVGFSNQGDPVEDFCRMKAIKNLQSLEMPLMIAISRKSFMGKLFGIEVNDRLMPTLILESLMISSGGNILRVHDVKQTKQMIDLLNYYNELS